MLDDVTDSKGLAQGLGGIDADERLAGEFLVTQIRRGHCWSSLLGTH